MAFGAKISLAVNKAGKAKFQKEIRDIANESPVIIKNIGIKLNATQRNALIRSINTSLEGSNLIVKLSRIDATKAIADLRTQISAALSGTGVKLPQASGVTASATQASAALKELMVLQSKLASLGKISLGFIDATKVEQFTARYRELNAEIEKSRILTGEAQAAAVSNISNAVAALNRQVVAQQSVERASAKTSATQIDAASISAQASIKDEARLTRILNLQKQYQALIQNNTAVYGRFSSVIDAAMRDLSSPRTLTDDRFAQIKRQFSEVSLAAKQMGLEGKGAFDRLSAGLARFGVWAIVTRVIVGAISTVKDMVAAVKELDLAMTELRKVTDLTSAAYDAFLENAGQKAKQLGATMSDVVNATADFARVGYDIVDSSTLASAALIYKNVGDGIDDISDASESLISTIKAFGFEANDSMKIVDAFNEVGNNFAISSASIGDALERSASSAAAANNTFEETIGMIVGMNAVLQNPERVGTILKTSTMYLRSMKTALEEAGESTEGLVEVTSKLRDKLLALTGVDIMLDSENVKSTYQIYKELAVVWKDINDTSQAAVLEMIGGKRNAAGISSLLSNWQDAEAAMETAMNSAGSATEENAKYIDSIAGKIAVMQAAFENMSSSVIGSDLVKVFVDMGTALINATTWLAKASLLLPAIVASIGVIRGFRLANNIAQATQVANGFIDTIIREQGATAVLAGSYQALSNVQQKIVAQKLLEKAATDTLNKDLWEQTLAELGIATATTTAGTAAVGAAAKFRAFGVALKTTFLANPVMLLITAITTLISIISIVNNNLEQARQKAIDTADQIQSTYDSAKNAYDQNTASLKNMSEQFKELSSGVDSNGKNISLTAKKYDEYLTLVRDITKISPDVVKAYDSEGNAIVDYTTLLNDAILAQETALENQRQLYIGQTGDIFSGNAAKIANATKDATDSIREIASVFRFEDFFDTESGGTGFFQGFFGNDEQFKNFDLAISTLGDKVRLSADNIIELYERRDEILGLGKEVGWDNKLLSSFEKWLNGLIVQYNQLNAIAIENSNILIESIRTEDWYKALPTAALDEFRTGLVALVGTYEDASDASVVAKEYGLQFSSALRDDGVQSILALSEGVNKGTVTLEEYNVAVANITPYLLSLGDAGKYALQYLSSLATTPTVNKGGQLFGEGANYESLAESISVAAKAYKVLESAREDIYSDGTVSEDTIASILEMIDGTEKLTDVITVQNGVLKLNEKAWISRSVAEYQDKIKNLQEENKKYTEYEDPLISTMRNRSEAVFNSNLNMIKNAQDATDINNQYADQISENNALIELYTIFIEDLTNALNNVSDSNAKFADSIDSVQEKYDILNEAIEESKSPGGLSAGMVSKITSLLTPEQSIIDYISVQNNKLIFNAEKWKEDTNALYQNEIATLRVANAKLVIANITETDSTKVSENTALIEENNGKIAIASVLIGQLADNTGKSAETIAEAYDRISNSVDDIGNIDRTVELTYDAYKKLIDTDVRYSAAVQYQNGILTLNRELYENITYAIIEETIAQAKANQEKIIASDEYGALIDNINNLNEEEQQRLDNLNAEIVGYSVLASELENATSAMNKFKNASDEVYANSYETAMGAAEIIENTLNNKKSELYGRVGREQFRYAIEFLIDPDIKVGTKEFKLAFKKVQKYLEAEGAGALSFYNDLVGKGIIDGVTGAIASNTTISSISKALGITEDLVRSMIDELNTYQDTPIEVIDSNSVADNSKNAGDIKDKVAELYTGVTDLSTAITEISPINIETGESTTRIGSISSGLGNLIKKLETISDFNTINVKIKTTYTSSNSSDGSSLGIGAGVTGLISSLYGKSSISGTSMAAGGTTLVGEIGRETVVDPKTNKWYTVGDSGAEFVDLPKNAIIFNAKQTNQLFSAGRTSRGNAMLSGNAALYYNGTSWVSSLGGNSNNDIVTGTATAPKPTSSGSGSSSASYDDLEDALRDRMDALETILDLTKDLIRYETEQQVDALNDQIDKFQKIIDLKKKSLQADKDEYDYKKDVSDKVQEIADITFRINQLELEGTRASKAEKASLLEEVYALQEDLLEAQSDYSYNLQVDALDKRSQEYADSKQNEIDILEDSISSEEKLYQLAISRISSSWETLYGDLITWNTEAGDIINDEITSAWNKAAEAVALYGSYLSALNATGGASAETPQTIKKGDTGSLVSQLQTMLNQSGASLSVDSIFGSLTKAAVIQYQKSRGLKVDGVVGPETWSSLLNLPKFHDGGVVGYGDGKDVVAKLQDGEWVLDEPAKESVYKIIDFQKELSNKLGIMPQSIGKIDATLAQLDNISSMSGNAPDNISSTLTFAPVISVQISHSGTITDDDANKYGHKIVNVVMDNLQDAFRRKGML